MGRGIKKCKKGIEKLIATPVFFTPPHFWGRESQEVGNKMIRNGQRKKTKTNGAIESARDIRREPSQR